MGSVMTKPLFGVSDKVIFILACSATETSYNIQISLVGCLDIILSVKHKTKAMIRLCLCAGWSAPLLFTNARRQVFSRQGPYSKLGNNTLGEVLFYPGSAEAVE